MRVVHKALPDSQIIGGKPSKSWSESLLYFVRTRFRKYFPRRPFVTENRALHAPALFPSGLGRELNKFGADVVLIGWLGNSTLSVEEISKIRGRIVWRFSDMWVFSGAEHYTSTRRYVAGYSRKSRPKDETGPDVNRATFRRKLRFWETPTHSVALSKWQAREARASQLTKEWPISVIPVPLEPDIWSPQDKLSSRRMLGVPPNDIVVLFGAGGGRKRQEKGADLLFSSLHLLEKLHLASGDERQIQLAIFGEEASDFRAGTINVSFLGRLDDFTLAHAYSASDVLVMPSRLEAFGQVGAEAQMCGTPVVGFQQTGVADVVEDFETGRLAEAFSAESLAKCTWWTLEDPARSRSLGIAARQRALSLWTPEVVAAHYRGILQDPLNAIGR